MSFWKLVGAIIVGNLLTGLVATMLWLLFIASLFSQSTSVQQAEAPPPVTSPQSYDVSSPTRDLNDWPSAKGRKLSKPDANGCVKELAEEAHGHC
jgi:hypothetical protein